MRVMRFYPQAWPLRTPFVIARGERTEVRVVVVDIEQDGLHGIGECTPYPRYGETEASVIGQINSVLHGIEQGISRDVLLQLLPAGAARNAIDSALWDLERQAAGQTLAEYAGAASHPDCGRQRVVATGGLGDALSAARGFRGGDAGATAAGGARRGVAAFYPPVADLRG